MFVDDDIRACPGWLQALLDGAREYPQADVFTGPVIARLEGPAPHSCGGEAPADHDPRPRRGGHPRRARLGRQHGDPPLRPELAGPFDVSLEHGGDEQEWQERLRRLRPQARVYVPVPRARRAPPRRRRRTAAGAGRDRLHPRAGRPPLRRPPRGSRPRCGGELRTLAGCLGHVLRHACPAGLVMVAHSGGRLREALARRWPPGARHPAER